MAYVVERLAFHHNIEARIRRHLERPPVVQVRHSAAPSRRTRQLPPTASMTSGAPVLKVRLAGRTTPTDLRLPSAGMRLWLMHLPSK